MTDGFDIKISIKKFFIGLIYAGVPFILTYAIGFLEVEEFPPEYAVYITAAIGGLHFLTNLVKHWND